MDLPKYTRPEFERRFLVTGDVGPLVAGRPCWVMHDRYLRCGRLRLRRIEETDTGRTVYKLCKKYASSAPNGEPIVNIYLSSSEYEALLPLDADTLTKRRYHDDHDGHRFGIDVFEGVLEGLVMCEAEVATAAGLEALRFPPYARIEVTDHPFFRGGTLCRATRTELAKAVEGLRVAGGARYAINNEK